MGTLSYFISTRAAIAQSVSVHLQHDRSQFRAPPMPAHRYVEEIGSAAMLVAKWLANAVPEVNFIECVTHTPLPSMNKAAHSSFETQRRCHQKLKTGY